MSEWSLSRRRTVHWIQSLSKGRETCLSSPQCLNYLQRMLKETPRQWYLVLSWLLSHQGEQLCCGTSAPPRWASQVQTPNSKSTWWWKEIPEATHGNKPSLFSILFSQLFHHSVALKPKKAICLGLILQPYQGDTSLRQMIILLKVNLAGLWVFISGPSVQFTTVDFTAALITPLRMKLLRLREYCFPVAAWQTRS